MNCQSCDRTDDHIHVVVNNAGDIGNVPKVEEAAAPHAVATTWTLPALGTVNAQANIPVEILPLDPFRKRAVVTFNGSGQVIVCHSQAQAQSLQQNVQQAADEGCLFTSPGQIVHESSAGLWAVAIPASTSQNTVGVKNAVTAPGAGAAIVNLTSGNLPAGTYQVTAQTYLDGTVVTATDDDNMRFVVGGVTIANQLQPSPTTNGNPPVMTYTYIVTVNGSQSMAVQAIGAGSAAAVYHASITATPFPFTVTTGVVQAGALAERRDR